MQHTWTYGEDFLCSALYIQNYIINRNAMPLCDFVRNIEWLFPQIGADMHLTNTLRNKITNIRKLSE